MIAANALSDLYNRMQGPDGMIVMSLEGSKKKYVDTCMRRLLDVNTIQSVMVFHYHDPAPGEEFKDGEKNIETLVPNPLDPYIVEGRDRSGGLASHKKWVGGTAPDDEKTTQAGETSFRNVKGEVLKSKIDLLHLPANDLIDTTHGSTILEERTGMLIPYTSDVFKCNVVSGIALGSGKYLTLKKRPKYEVVVVPLSKDHAKDVSCRHAWYLKITGVDDAEYYRIVGYCQTEVSAQIIENNALVARAQARNVLHGNAIAKSDYIHYSTDTTKNEYFQKMNIAATVVFGAAGGVNGAASVDVQFFRVHDSVDESSCTIELTTLRAEGLASPAITELLGQDGSTWVNRCSLLSAKGALNMQAWNHHVNLSGPTAACLKVYERVGSLTGGERARITAGNPTAADTAAVKAAQALQHDMPHAISWTNTLTLIWPVIGTDVMSMSVGFPTPIQAEPGRFIQMRRMSTVNTKAMVSWIKAGLDQVFQSGLLAVYPKDTVLTADVAYKMADELWEAWPAHHPAKGWILSRNPFSAHILQKPQAEAYDQSKLDDHYRNIAAYLKTMDPTGTLAKAPRCYALGDAATLASKPWVDAINQLLNMRDDAFGSEGVKAVLQAAARGSVGAQLGDPIVDRIALLPAPRRAPYKQAMQTILLQASARRIVRKYATETWVDITVAATPVLAAVAESARLAWDQIQALRYHEA